MKSTFIITALMLLVGQFLNDPESFKTYQPIANSPARPIPCDIAEMNWRIVDGMAGFRCPG